MPRRSRGERGALVPVVASMMVVLVTVAAFAVDLGMQRVTRRDLQALSDVVSLDMVRALDGRATNQYPTTELDQVRDLSLSRNAGQVLGKNLRVTYELGDVDANGAFYRTLAAAVPRAVRVTAQGTVDFAFAPGSGAAIRSAVARAEPQACFSVGSYAARVRLGDSTLLGPLLGILGTGANLNLLDAQGLAAADISLLGLLDSGLHAGSLTELLDTNLRLGDFYLAAAKVLEREVGRTAQVALLERLGHLDLGALQFKLGDLLHLAGGDASGLSTRLNLFDLVSGSAFLANGTNALAVPGLSVNLLGLTQLNGALTVGQGPSTACGPPGRTTATASQVGLALHGNLASVNLGLLSVDGPVDITVSGLPADGTLTDLRCAPDLKTLKVLASHGLLDVKISLTLRLKLLPILLGGITLLNVPVVVTTSRGSPATTIDLQVTSDRYGGVVSTGAASLGLPNLTVDTSGLSAAGLPLGLITSAVVDPLLRLVLNPLVQSLDNVVLGPLLHALGIEVAGADYASVPKTDCGVPALRG